MTKTVIDKSEVLCVERMRYVTSYKSQCQQSKGLLFSYGMCKVLFTVAATLGSARWVAVTGTESRFPCTSTPLLPGSRYLECGSVGVW